MNDAKSKTVAELVLSGVRDVLLTRRDDDGILYQTHEAIPVRALLGALEGDNGWVFRASDVRRQYGVVKFIISAEERAGRVFPPHRKVGALDDWSKVPSENPTPGAKETSGPAPTEEQSSLEKLYLTHQEVYQSVDRRSRFMTQYAAAFSPADVAEVEEAVLDAQTMALDAWLRATEKSPQTPGFVYPAPSCTLTGCTGNSLNGKHSAINVPPPDPDGNNLEALQEALKGQDTTHGQHSCPEGYAARVLETVRNRGSDYGTPADNHQLTADLLTSFFSRKTGLPVKISAEDVCLINIIQKVARLAHHSKDDNYLDIAGYAENVAMLRKDQRQR